MAGELQELRECRLDGILFLDAGPEVLINRKASDATRKRGFFDFYLKQLYPYKKKWFAGFDYTTFLDVDRMSMEETEAFVIQWLSKFEK